MRASRVTIADLARSLELSTCTVSKILNRSFDGFTYSKETIRRVEEMAKKVGYTVNVQARSLRTRKTMLIGLLLPSAQVSVFSGLTNQLELQVRKRGYQVLIVHSRNDPGAEPSLITSLVARGIDGLIWIPCQDKVDLSTVGLKPGFPAVILDRPCCTRELPFVATDNRAAAQVLAHKMYAFGHRHIAVLNAPTGDRSMRERFQGLRDVFGQGIRIRNLSNEAGEAKMAVMKLLRREGEQSLPSALVALSETLAVGALAGLRDLNLRIPDEISFASFDDFPLASCWSPRLTAVCQDIGQLAASAAELIFRRMENPSARFTDIRVSAALEWRDSVGRVKIRAARSPAGVS